MRLTVILVVLFASLLMVTGAAFAAGCCYDQCFYATCTALNNPANSFTDHIAICYYDDTAVICDQGGFIFNASLFSQGLNDQAIIYNNSAVGYITFHGYDDSAYNGLYYDGNDRYKCHGVEEECP
jgi:hypothetical protein